MIPAVRRRMFNVLSLLSLLLCSATVVLWERSYRLEEYLYYEAGSAGCSDQYGVLQWRGRIQIERLQNGANSTDPEQTRNGRWTFGRHVGVESNPKAVIRIDLRWLFDFGELGVPKRGVFDEPMFASGQAQINLSSPPPATISSYTIFPHALLTAIAGLAPAIWLLRWLIRRRRGRREARIGHCRHCGYDLRATP